MVRTTLNKKQQSNITGEEIIDSSITIDDLNITTPNKAVITKLIAGNNISLTSSGVDPGTGIVTINATGNLSTNWTDISNKPSTIIGYNIQDSYPLLQIFMDCSISNQSYQLPDPSNTSIINVKRIDSNTSNNLTITCVTNGVTIDSNSDIILNPFQALTFKSYNGQWYIV